MEFRYVIFTVGLHLNPQLLHTTFRVSLKFGCIHSQCRGYSADHPHFLFEPIRVVEFLKEPALLAFEKVLEF